MCIRLLAQLRMITLHLIHIKYTAYSALVCLFADGKFKISYNKMERSAQIPCQHALSNLIRVMDTYKNQTTAVSCKVHLNSKPN